MWGGNKISCLLNRIDWYEAWAGCKMSAGDCQFFSSALLLPPQHRVAKTRNWKNIFSKYYFIMLRESSTTVLQVCVGHCWNFVVWVPSITSGLQLAQMGNTTLAIGNIEGSATDILEQMLVYSEPALSLYFFFCIWGFGTVALMGNKSCYSTSLNFPPGHLKANMGKVFPSYHFLILRRIHSCFESDNCFQMGTRVNLGKARPVHTNLWTISLSLNFLFNFDLNFYFQFSFLYF